MTNNNDLALQTHDEKMNSLKKEMEHTIAAMVHTHNTEKQTWKDSCNNQLDETKPMHEDAINKLTNQIRFYKNENKK